MPNQNQIEDRDVIEVHEYYGGRGLIDASTLPKWILYPLMILVILILLAALILIIIVGYSCLHGNCQNVSLIRYGWRY